MVKKKLIFYCVFCLLSMIASAQDVSNLKVNQEGNNVVVTYKLDSNDACDVYLYVTTDKGNTWTGPLTKVTGDVGSNVTAGEKRITWNVLDEFDELRGDDIHFQIRAVKRLGSKSGAMRPLSSLGFQWGKIAKYGLLFETMGKGSFGFHAAARSSLLKKEDIEKAGGMPNKAEFDLGPMIKITRGILFHIAGGKGFTYYTTRDDYRSQFSAVRQEYWCGSMGLTFRLGDGICFSGGASFMSMNKKIYTPEAIFAISLNLN